MENNYDFISIGDTVIDAFIKLKKAEILGVPEPDPSDAALNMASTTTTTERGSSAFRRTTEVDESTIGNSTNTDSQLGGVILPPNPR